MTELKNLETLLEQTACMRTEEDNKECTEAIKSIRAILNTRTWPTIKAEVDDNWLNQVFLSDPRYFNEKQVPSVGVMKELYFAIGEGLANLGYNIEVREEQTPMMHMRMLLRALTALHLASIWEQVRIDEIITPAQAFALSGVCKGIYAACKKTKHTFTWPEFFSVLTELSAAQTLPILHKNLRRSYVRNNSSSIVARDEETFESVVANVRSVMYVMREDSNEANAWFKGLLSDIETQNSLNKGV